METIIRLFASKIDDLNNNSCKMSTDEQITEWAKKYTMEEINKEKSGVKIESAFLYEEEKVVGWIVRRNDVNISDQVNNETVVATIRNLRNF